MTTKHLKVINYISLRNGRCGLTTDTENEVLRREGTNNVVFVRPATQSEVNWVKAMGGNVPVGRVAKPEEAA